MNLIVEELTQLHDRNSFDCGTVVLNTYLKQFAKQNQRHNISKTFVAVQTSASRDLSDQHILGYYTLSSGQIAYDDLPKTMNHPRYPVSVARIARLAVDVKNQGRGIGGFLLYDALNKVKSAAEVVGIYAVIVDAKDEHAAEFYQQYGFAMLQSSELTLFLPMKTIHKLF